MSNKKYMVLIGDVVADSNIDIDAATKYIKDLFANYPNQSVIVSIKEMQNDTYVPDLVDVVRCDICIYRDECMQKIDCEYAYKDIVYCSYGERR